MDVTKRVPEPVLPPPVYSITGLTEDEARFLRDLTGRFADSPGDNGIEHHFHTTLYCKLADVLGIESFGSRAWKFTATVEADGGGEVTGPIFCLHCERP